MYFLLIVNVNSKSLLFTHFFLFSVVLLGMFVDCMCVYFLYSWACLLYTPLFVLECTCCIPVLVFSCVCTCVHLSTFVVHPSVLVVFPCGSKSSLFADFLPRPTHPPSTLPPCSTFLMIIIIEHIIMVKMSIYVQAKFQHHDMITVESPDFYVRQMLTWNWGRL